ncbi:hypothetical protein GLOIN_2v1625072 [Rhizophagus irregularis DAOM 181602=DAOM 197198]|uniref:Uncharacterized protein n=1 Tax=Rhizophagus irregularis (strain DAOM 181602 / DAOM 197198 / MUCL 43194) TaxID=747089 RepID=A0A2P4PW90_RHIID|nr:hypothetical protein GLOIN_2v1625072 [Rhizophagus irregularis DAOM 181602=DAOM 197198]POG69669.1 hypothetical protein GLOIN_2v1625072 [Rhizophagus irregularis DAOM 181602=DAOM 197198]|eukprot:XP_025176535.1 hypothetical protein GLOIN_2v1625072 [Rhizophagus irregularis DAOM 181602=DAOM 197198]
MNNKKSKIETFNSVSDLVKHKKIKPRKSKIETSASVSDLIKSKKTKIEISTSVSDLIKSKTANSIKSKKPKMADLIKPRKRYLYPCYCIRCGGAEVDFRTQENHTNDENTITARKQKRLIIIQDVNLTKKRKRASSSNLDSSQHNSGFNPFNEDTDSFQPNNNENIHTLFSSSPLLPNPFYFHVPTPDENKDNDDIYITMKKKKMMMMRMTVMRMMVIRMTVIRMMAMRIMVLKIMVVKMNAIIIKKKIMMMMEMMRRRRRI